MMVTNEYDISSQTADLSALCQAIEMKDDKTVHNKVNHDDDIQMEDVAMGIESGNSVPIYNSAFSSNSPSFADLTNMSASLMKNMPSPQLEKAGLEGLFAILQAMDNGQSSMDVDSFEVNTSKKASSNSAKKSQKTRSYNWNGANINPLLQVGGESNLPFNSIGAQTICNFTNARNAIEEHFSKALGRPWKIQSSNASTEIGEKPAKIFKDSKDSPNTTSRVSSATMMKDSLYTSANTSLASSSSTINSNHNAIQSSIAPRPPSEPSNSAAFASGLIVNHYSNNNANFRSPKSSTNNSTIASTQASPYISTFSLPSSGINSSSSSGTTPTFNPAIPPGGVNCNISNRTSLNRHNYISPYNFKLGCLGISAGPSSVKGKENSVNASESTSTATFSSPKLPQTLGSHLPCLPPIPSSSTLDKGYPGGNISLLVKGNNPNQTGPSSMLSMNTSSIHNKSSIKSDMDEMKKGKVIHSGFRSSTPRNNSNNDRRLNLGIKAIGKGPLMIGSPCLQPGSKSTIIPSITSVNSPRNPMLHYIAPAPHSNFYHQQNHSISHQTSLPNSQINIRIPATHVSPNNHHNQRYQPIQAVIRNNDESSSTNHFVNNSRRPLSPVKPTGSAKP